MEMIHLTQTHLKGRKTTDATKEILEVSKDGKWQKQQYTWPDGETIKIMITNGYCWEM